MSEDVDVPPELSRRSPANPKRRARRKMRVFWAAGFLVAAAAGSTWFGLSYYRSRSAKPYRPG